MVRGWNQASTVVLPVPGGPWIKEMGSSRVASSALCWLALRPEVKAGSQGRGSAEQPAAGVACVACAICVG
jgi:hypothetical protein